jgi:hypothetical protein
VPGRSSKRAADIPLDLQNTLIFITFAEIDKLNIK